MKKCECQDCKKNTKGVVDPLCCLNTLQYDYKHPKKPAKICVDYESNFNKGELK